MPEPEKDTKQTDAMDKAIADGEAAAKEFDKDRQRADQAEASLRKTQAERDQLNGQLAEMQAKHEELTARMAELTAGKNAEADIALPEIDPETMTGDEIAQVLPQITTVIRQLNADLATVRTKAEQLAAERQQEQQRTREETQKNATFRKVCRRLEGKYGAGLQNRAIELMEGRIEAEGAPPTQAEATLMLDECFAAAKTEAATKQPGKGSEPKASGPPTDTGGGGTRPRFGNVEITPGSLDGVAAQFEKVAPSG